MQYDSQIKYNEQNTAFAGARGRGGGGKLVSCYRLNIGSSRGRNQTRGGGALELLHFPANRNEAEFCRFFLIFQDY